MTDDLRARIAAVLAEAQETHNGISDLELADAVIRELGLKREETLHSVLPDYDRNTVRANVWAHRYVTKWETSE